MIPLAPKPNENSQWRRTAADRVDDGAVSALEAEFAEYCNAEYAVAFSSRAVALRAAFEALGVGRGAHIIATPFSTADGANAIRRCGATPTFADVDPKTYTLDAGNVAHVLRHSDREFAALLVSHTYGLPAEMNPLLELALEHEMAVVEDGAGSHGAEYGGQRVGTFGDIACFSLPGSPGSPVEAVGVLATDVHALAERATQFRDAGRDAPSDGTGANAGDAASDLCPSELAADACHARLTHCSKRVRERRANAARLTNQLRPLSVTPPVEPAETRHVYHRYTIRCSDRDRLRHHLSNVGVESTVRPLSCVHDRPSHETACAFAPIAEQVAAEVVSLPVHSGLTEEDIDTVATAIATFENC